MPAPRQPKFVQVARDLESLILSGQWTPKRLPSVRDLAEKHSVSVVTAARALQVLRDKGLISSVERSGSYLNPSATASAWGLQLRMTPGPWRRATTSVVSTGFEEVARAEGLALRLDPFDPTAGSTDRELLRQVRQAKGGGLSGLFYLPSRVSTTALKQDEVFLAACRTAGLPVVLIERNLRGDGRPLDFDLVATDDLDGGVTVTRHLLGLGKRRVACVTASPTSSHTGRAAGYLYAARVADMPPLVLEQDTTRPDKDAYAALADKLLGEKADGVIAYSDYAAVALTIELLARGAKIPDTIAVAGFDDLPIGTTFSLGITTYAFPAVAVARQAMHRMRLRTAGDDGPPLRVSVPGTLVVRESTAGRS